MHSDKTMVTNRKHGDQPRLKYITAAAQHNVASHLLETHPDLQGLQVMSGAPLIGGFSPENDTISVGVDDPAVMTHEMAHAVNIRRSPMYQKLLKLTDVLARVNRQVSTPAAMLIKRLVQDRTKKNDMLNTMSGVSAMLSAPRLAEELNASSQALSWLNNDPDAAAKMRMALGAYARQALEPIAVYQAARRDL